MNELALRYCIEELEKISAAQTSMGYVNAPGSSNMGGSTGGAMSPSAMTSPVPGSSTGMTNMPGMSLHCNKCFAKIKDGETKNCPKCGNSLDKVLDLKTLKKQQMDNYEDYDPQDNGYDSDSSDAPTSADSVSDDLMGKTSASRAGNPIHRIRCKVRSGRSISEALEQLMNATASFPLK